MAGDKGQELRVRAWVRVGPGLWVGPRVQGDDQGVRTMAGDIRVRGK